MSLNIISKIIENPENVFKTFALTSLKAGFNFYYHGKLYNNSERIEINIQSETTSNLDDSILFEIIPVKEQFEMNHAGVLDIVINSENYYLIAGSDGNGSAELNYYFSLMYLKLNPLHLIIYYDTCIISLEKIERIELTKGFSTEWTKEIMTFDSET